jgi:hypothetical protein
MLIYCERETHFIEILYELESEVPFLIKIATAIHCRSSFCVLVCFYCRRFGDNQSDKNWIFALFYNNFQVFVAVDCWYSYFFRLIARRKCGMYCTTSVPEIIAASLAGKETEQSLVLLPGFQCGSVLGFCVHSVADWQRRRKNHNRCFGSPYYLRLQR